MNERTVSWEEFESEFKPLQNPLVSDAPFNGWMLETFGPELELAKQAPENKVWTVLDVDGHIVFGSGFHFVNRMGYIICEVAVSDDEFVTMDDGDDEEFPDDADLAECPPFLFPVGE